MHHTAADLNNLAANLHRQGKYYAASIAARKALAIEPHSGTLWQTYGGMLWNLGDYDGAKKSLIKATQLDPSLSGAYANLGLLYSSLGDRDAAEEVYAKSLALDPDKPATLWDRAMLRLSFGDWKAGFEDYEVRLEYRGPEYYPKMPYPMWDGKADLNGKTLYIQAEQGIGDSILFARYLPWLKEQYPDAKLLFLINHTIIELFWEYRGVVEFVPSGVPWPEADYGLFLMSLPRIHGSRPDNVPADPGFIRKRAEPWAQAWHLENRNDGTLRVGICWGGNPENMTDAYRSVPLEEMLRLADHPNITFYSLQVGPAAIDLDLAGAGGKNGLVKDDVAKTIEKRGFSSTAALMLNMDLVITVCTSVAHLAGVLGVPTWTLLCADHAYWVWLREREDCVWYPSMRLFRQPNLGDWRSVIDHVKAELAALADYRI